MMKGGTIVDVTIIDAPSSTKNAEKKQDPEMHQTKKGGQWRFGMKCHIGVDAGSGLVHTIEVTAANEHDITVASKLIREDDEVVYGDSGYLGIQKREEIQADPHLVSIDYRINSRPKSGSLASRKSHIEDWQRTRTGFTLCLFLPTFMCWVLPGEVSAGHNMGAVCPFWGSD